MIKTKEGYYLNKKRYLAEETFDYKNRLPVRPIDKMTFSYLKEQGFYVLLQFYYMIDNTYYKDEKVFNSFDDFQILSSLRKHYNKLKKELLNKDYKKSLELGIELNGIYDLDDNESHKLLEPFLLRQYQQFDNLGFYITRGD